jgi:glycosyltransferase involved in cell wall biosynthesis
VVLSEPAANGGRKVSTTLSRPFITENVTKSLAQGSANGGKGTVLVVTYNWPPDASVGAVRPVKLAKYLRLHGWKTVVLTVEPQFYEDIDARIEDENREYVALRTKCLPSPLGIYGWAKAWVFRLFGRDQEFKLSKLRGTGGEREQQAAEGFLGKVKRVILSLLFVPDQHLGWLPFAVAAGVRAVKIHRISCVISTGPPFTAHLVGLAVKALCRVAWVVDFRDPWTGNDQKLSDIKSSLAEALDRWLETLVIRHADSIVCVTPAMTERYRALHRTIPTQNYVTITNGFEEEEFKRLRPVQHRKKFTITHVGRFDYGRSPEMLLQALGEMIQEGQIDPQDLSVRFIGFCRYAGGKSVEEMVARNGLVGVVEITDLIPREEALTVMLQAHVLVLLAEHQALQVPAKAYEYIAAGGHILAFTGNKGATADLIARVGGGVVVSPGDFVLLKRTLKQWFDDSRGAAGGNEDLKFCDPNRAREYEWSQIGSQYAALIEKKVTG